jgi:DNA-directed RNA polymerase II subunit RPB2
MWLSVTQLFSDRVPEADLVYLSKPQMTEAEGSINNMFPSQARLRNLTYAAPCYLDMKKEVRSCVGGPGEV